MKNVKYLLFIIILLPSIVLAQRTDLYDFMSGQGILDNQSSHYVQNTTGIDFSNVASDNNGKGIYIVSSTKDNKYPIYYYRGVVDNNVSYAGFCWKIVRTTDKGGIKLLYSGKLNEDGSCTTTGEEMIIEKSLYGNSTSEEQLGYMYSLESEEVNLNDSVIKTVVDNWFKQNMLNYIDDLEDSVFCNDRSIDDTGRVAAYGRIIDGTPTLDCKELNDRFTVYDDNGNGDLTYPVGIITADEVLFAGGYLEIANVDYFLNVGVSYWSMTPYSANKIFYPNSKGVLNRNSITYSAGVRPMVVLKNGASFENGNGTVNNPYQILDSYEYEIYSEGNIIDEGQSFLEDQIVINIPVKDGYIFKEFNITDINSNKLDLKINKIDNDTYSIQAPNSDIKIEIKYEVLVENPNTTNYVQKFILIIFISVVLIVTLAYKLKPSLYDIKD